MFTATSIPVKIPLIFMSFSGKTTVIFISCSFALLRSKPLRIHMSISLPTFPSHLHWTISGNAITGIWGIEVSFRYLKHAAGLLYFHSKQPEFLKQEIYSRLILYNFGIFIANEAAEENRKKKRDGSNKYLYELDFSSALKTARKFFMRRDSDRHIDIIRLMMKYVHAVKDRFRQFQRPLRGISAIHFGYR